MSTPNYCRALAIVHGKSELNIVKYISSNLRINLPIYSEKNGKRSIQINDLPKKLTNDVFKNRTCFLRNYPAVEHKKTGLIHFKIFILMDLDDVNDQSIANNYKNGFVSNLGQNHWIKPYLCPIFFDQNLEDVLKKINWKYAHRNKNKKDYIKVFPVDHGKISDDKEYDDIVEFKNALALTNLTNLNVFIDYCLDNKPDFS